MPIIAMAPVNESRLVIIRKPTERPGPRSDETQERYLEGLMVSIIDDA